MDFTVDASIENQILSSFKQNKDTSAEPTSSDVPEMTCVTITSVAESKARSRARKQITKAENGGKVQVNRRQRAWV